MPSSLLPRLSLLVLTAAVCLLGTPALAQPLGKTVVIPFFAGEPAGPALELTKDLDALLRTRRIASIPLHDARDRFASRSRPPQTASLSDIDALAREAQSAMRRRAKDIAYGAPGCAILEDGALWRWGGAGGSRVPKQVGTANDWQAISSTANAVDELDPQNELLPLVFTRVQSVQLPTTSPRGSLSFGNQHRTEPPATPQERNGSALTQSSRVPTRKGVAVS